MAGYSGTPLAKKLGIKEGYRVFLSGAPEHYMELVTPLPEGVQFVSQMDDTTDIVHVFSDERMQLELSLKKFLTKLKPDGVIWVS